MTISKSGSIVRISLECSSSTHRKIIVSYKNRAITFSGGSFLSDLYMAFMSALELINQAMDNAIELVMAADDELQAFMQGWLTDHHVEVPETMDVETFLMIAQRVEYQVVAA